MRQRHPVLLEVLTSAGFLGVVAVHGYLVTHLGWPGFLVGLISGFAWGLMFTLGVPSWLHTDVQVLRGHSRDDLFPSRELAVLASSRAEVPPGGGVRVSITSGQVSEAYANSSLGTKPKPRTVPASRPRSKTCL